MSAEFKCFPREWIGETLIRMNDYTFQIGNNSARQVSIPSGYGKATDAYWTPESVLVICSDTNNLKFHFVGYQRNFIAYANETEPHDIHAYRKAIEECKRIRGEHNVNKVQDSTKSQNNSPKTIQDYSKSNLNFGQVVRKVKDSVDTFRSISDSSEFERDANDIVNDYLTSQQNWMSNVHREAEELDHFIQKNANKRDKELERLRKYDKKIIARQDKEIIFSNLEVLFNCEAVDFDECAKYFAQYMGVRTQDGFDAILRAMEGYRKSRYELGREVGMSIKFRQSWFEIFYLISEGLVFMTDNINFFVRLIDLEFGGTNHPDIDEGESVENFLKMCYSKFSRPLHWGYNFEKYPYEDRVQARMDFLVKHICLDKPYVYDSDLERILTQNEATENNNHKQFISSKNGFKGNKQKVEDNDKVNLNQKEKNNNSKKKSIDLKNIFPELNEKFNAEKIEDESIQPKGFFDFATKNRNRRVENLKDKRRDIQEEIEISKINLRKDLISIMKSLEKLLEKEKIIIEIKDTPIKTNREKERMEEKIESVEEQIESIKEDIESSNQDLKVSFKELLSYVDKYNKVNRELFSFTSSKRYSNEYVLQGRSFDIANSISQNVRMSDSSSLIGLFKEFID